MVIVNTEDAPEIPSSEDSASPRLPIIADQIQQAPKRATFGRHDPAPTGAENSDLFVFAFGRRRELRAQAAEVIAMPAMARADNGPHCGNRRSQGDVAQLGSYVSRKKFAILRYHFSSFTARHFELDDMTNKLTDIGKILVGDIVQLTPDELVDLTGASPKSVQILVDLLAQTGLCLGKRIPGWDRNTPAH